MLDIYESQQDLSAADKELLDKAVGLTYAYLSVLERLDAVRTPQDLRQFLGFSSNRKRLSKKLIKKDLSLEYAERSYTQKTQKILAEQVEVTIQANIEAKIIKNMFVSPDKVELGSEVSSFNRFKGLFTGNTRNWYLVALNEVLNNPNSKLNKGLITQFKKASIKSITQKNAYPIVSSHASKNLFEALEDMYVSLIKTGTAAPYTSKGFAKETSKIKLPKIKLPKLKVKIPQVRAPQLRTATGQFYGLVPLQRLLDATLVQRVKDNMGTGSRRDILNLRSGRFAESVKVENLSQSREGMITAFYSYMRNPYGTFSQGGRQESPKTRDPKLLISQSIRQIGAAVVANRMRAVLV